MLEQETRSDSPDPNRTGEQQTKTSFLIEDILFRGQNRPKPSPLETIRRPYQYERETKTYFGSVPNAPRPHIPGQEGSYLQVAMGALGAYLHTPNTYKSVETPYFLSQGEFFKFCCW